MLEEEESETLEPVETDPTIQDIPVIDESQDGGKLHTSIFKALKRRRNKGKKEKKAASKEAQR